VIGVYLTNSGSVAGGIGGGGSTGAIGSAGGAGGSGGIGIGFNNSGGSINSITITNIGSATGSGGGGGGNGGVYGNVLVASGGAFGDIYQFFNGGTGGTGGGGGNGINFDSAGGGGIGGIINVGNRGHAVGGDGGMGGDAGLSYATYELNGAPGGNGGDGGAGIGFESSGSGKISGISLTNDGSSTGGSGGNGGNGAEFGTTDGPISTPPGEGESIIGANGGDGGAGGNGIQFESVEGISSISLTNSGSATGGNGGLGGNGIIDFVGTFSLNPQGSGGSAGSGGSGGTGIEFDSAGEGDISGITLTNGGLALGGSGGGIGAAGTRGVQGLNTSNSGSGGAGGDGVGFNSMGSISAVTLVNSGTAAGGNGGSAVGVSVNINNINSGGTGGTGGSGVKFNSAGGVSGITLTNNGSAKGGNGGDTGITGSETGGENAGIGGNGGGGIELTSGGKISGVTFLNNGSATGGEGGGSNSSGSVSGTGGNGIEFYSTGAGDINNISLENNGIAMGGSGGSGGGSNRPFGNGGAGGGGIEFISGGSGNISDITLTNYASAIGGNGGGGGASSGSENGGNGIGFNSAGKGSIREISLTNDGSTIGGSGGGPGLSGIGGNGGSGIEFKSTGSGSISDVSVTNNGSAMGGNSGGGTSGLSGAAIADSEGGSGVGLESIGNLSGITVTNNGSIAGGVTLTSPPLTISPGLPGDGLISIGPINSGSTINIGPGALAVNSRSEIGGTLTPGTSIPNDLPLTPGASAVVLPGSSGILLSGSTVSNINISNNGSVTGGGGGAGVGDGGDGVYFLSAPAGSMAGMLLVNSGTISGGIAGASGGNGGAGIYFNVGNSARLTINNYGLIIGGAGEAGGNAGMGIQGNENNLAVNNWGVISAGAGLNPVAVSFGGNGNRLSLLGHSSVNGVIQGIGKNDVLDFAFSGLSPSALSALHAQLAPYLNGQPSSGSVTVRGVTYTWDPLIVEWYASNGSNTGGTTSVRSYELAGLTGNQRAVGASLDSASSNPAPGSALSNLYNSIDLSGNVPGALEALSPQEYQIYGDLAIENATVTVQNIDQRLDNIRDGSESIDLSGVGGGVDPVAEGFGKESDGTGSKEITPGPAPEKRWGAFATGNGFFFRGSNHDVDLRDGNADGAGTLAGVDGKVGDNGVIGALFAYDHAIASLGGNGGHATIDTYTGGLYGAWHLDGFYVNGLGTYGRNSYSSDRNIVFPGFSSTAGGATNGDQYTASLDGGYDWHVNEHLTLSPLAGLQYVHLDVDGFHESGAGAADLGVGSQSTNSLESRLGGRVGYHVLARGDVAVAADLHAAWQHEYLDDSRGISGEFLGAGLSHFSVRTSDPLRDGAVLGTGLDVTLHEWVTLFADYEIELWSRGSIEQTVNGGCRVGF
jgi:uncharacterized protein with beta-barrel porin domain